jgi:acetyl-CoA synthetase
MEHNTTYGDFESDAFKKYLSDYDKSVSSDDFWLNEAKRLDWTTFPTKSLEGGYDEVNFKWFSDGQLNISANCLDRHLETKSDQTAIIWAKDELGDYEHISYKQLHEKVCKTANALKELGVKKGDRVCLYLPMVPELAVSMLACVRIGAIHSIVFAGFSAKALQDRINDCEAKIVITSDIGLRGGKQIPLKEITNEALKGTKCIEHCIVLNKGNVQAAKNKIDVDWDELINKQSSDCPAESFDAETPLFILYTSGSTGKPKGLMHTSGGYLTYAAYTHKTVFNYQDGDIYFCAADIGWVTGHSYIIYGPLANGATTVMFESTPVYPNPDRYWKIVDDLNVNIFYTAPTALRALAQCGDQWLEGTKRDSLKVLGTVGEPINPEIWTWYYHQVGKEKAPIVDTWWQTETGGILLSPIPNVTPLKPGSATRPLYGIQPIIVDAQSGEEKTGNDIEGALCMKQSWPGQARTIYGDHDRFKEVYFSQYKGRYFTGDGALRDKNGHYWITGRMDDVINVSGHRLGTAEIESAIMESELVGEVAVVGCQHEIKGTGIFAYVIPQNDSDDPEQVKASAIEHVVKEIGKIARPDKIQFCNGLPKTRSGKVMRRILRKIAAEEYSQLGDTSTLADPSVVEGLIEGHKNLK